MDDEVTASSGVTHENMDISIKPGDDFFEYVNGTWLKNTEIPSDKRRYGSFDVLRDNAQTDVRAIIEEASASGAEFGSNEQKVGDLFKSYMDMEKRKALGTDPLQPRIAQIDAIMDLIL
jgi:putative endopeptidase